MNVAALGVFGVGSTTPVIGVARSGRILKNWFRSKKNGSSRAPANAVMPGWGEKTWLIVPVVRPRLGEQERLGAGHGRGQRAGDGDGLVRAGAGRLHLDDQILDRIAGVVDLELVQHVRVKGNAADDCPSGIRGWTFITSTTLFGSFGLGKTNTSVRSAPGVAAMVGVSAWSEPRVWVAMEKTTAGVRAATPTSAANFLREKTIACSSSIRSACRPHFEAARLPDEPFR